MTGRRDDRTEVPLPAPATDAERATKFPSPTPEQGSVVQGGPGTPDVELEGGSRVDEQD
ncbi:MAG: hypothetical protein AB1511_05330 [Deinococcota bacterium]